jgi:hypothetical protein
MSEYTVAREMRSRAATSAGVRNTPSDGRATGAPNGVVPYASCGTVCVRPDPESSVLSGACLAVRRCASPWKAGVAPWGLSGRWFKSSRPDHLKAPRFFAKVRGLGAFVFVADRERGCAQVAHWAAAPALALPWDQERLTLGPFAGEGDPRDEADRMMPEPLRAGILLYAATGSRTSCRGGPLRDLPGRAPTATACTGSSRTARWATSGSGLAGN